jgi:hypothetical protein
VVAWGPRTPARRQKKPTRMRAKMGRMTKKVVSMKAFG